MSVAALLLAAGRGERLGSELPKAFVSVAGRPLMHHAFGALAAAESVDLVVPVLARGDLPRWQAALGALGDTRKLAEAVVGGEQRQDSMAAGLAALPSGVSLVAVHDAARALVRPDEVDRVVRAAARDGAAILAAPVGDTIKRVRQDRIVETPERSECYAAQTPQVFRIEILRDALAKARAEGRTGTDDAQIVEALGVAVTVVVGDAINRKVTHPEDLIVAERVLRDRVEGNDAS